MLHRTHGNAHLFLIMSSYWWQPCRWMYYSMWHCGNIRFHVCMCVGCYRGFHTTALYVVIHPERHERENPWPRRVRLCVRACSCAAAYSVHQPSWCIYTLYLLFHPLVILCSSLRSRLSRRKLREGSPAVRLQAKIFVTQSPVAVSSCISQSLSFPFNSLPLPICFSVYLLLFKVIIKIPKSSKQSSFIRSGQAQKTHKVFIFLAKFHALFFFTFTSYTVVGEQNCLLPKSN